ncbi:ABC transporter substrate binding protein [Bradyrhizobium sp. AS23.2]|uniref:ABC transporter substrate binding protein n=1 Tax=Bradyrhizobium sp. AS23.2 TaxID=1680155 RepID=UPI0014318FA4|nr:ABC transporter substrate binding protein [Bradyrhizobium sp. AS23.2]
MIAYGPNHADIFRRSAAVIDKILKGEKPGDIPVQRTVKFNLRLNLRTAKALGVDISPALLALADEVIE